MSKVYVEKIHPTRNPNYCVISGERDGGGLGFWAGPDIQVGGQLITPHVSIRMTKQWLESAELVVDAKEHQRVLDELAAERAAHDETKAAQQQLERRLTRVYPRKRRTREAVTT